MNHAVCSFPDVPVCRDESNNHLYHTIVAAITDINITLPASQAIVFRLEQQGRTVMMILSQNGEKICEYALTVYPHAFSRLWAVMMPGLARMDVVESVKQDIVTYYSPESINI